MVRNRSASYHNRNRSWEQVRDLWQTESRDGVSGHRENNS